MAVHVSNFGQSICKLKALFFDSPTVIAAVDKAARKVLNHIGGMIRLTARRSIRKAPSYKAASKPGKPPLSHTGLLRNYILYSFDPQSNSVVVGPAALNAKGKNVPAILEYGGQSTVYSKNGKRKINIKARPFMNPALVGSQRKITDIWKESIRK